ncbi:MAG: TIGR04255 family protein [Candidatus Obscuribacterales bacterium]|nr:TIGR04255 family protein [Candidatus Obscuribacterales bacterium]
MHPEKISFKKPPLIETVIGIQFNPLENFRVVDYGLFWTEFLRADFPEVQEVPPINLRLEDKQLAVQRQIWQLVQEVPLPRVWYLGPDNELGQELVQVQPNLLMHNWRKKSPSNQVYPRYHINIERFRKVLSQFMTFVETRQLGTFTPNQCELTYINHIPVDEICGQPVEMFRRVFNVFQPNVENALDGRGTLDSQSFTSTYWIESISSRFHVAGNLAQLATTDQPIIDFRLTCRGTPPGSTANELINWFNVAHSNVVETFARLTTSEMHTYWGKNP